MWRGSTLLLVVAACRLNFDPQRTDGGGGTGDGIVDDGAVVAGTEVTLSTTGTCASVAWSGDRAGVVWREGTTSADIWYATVSNTGQVLDGPITVGGALANADCPAIAWTGGQFLIAMSYGTVGDRDIEVTSVVGTSPSAFITIVNDPADSRAPTVGYTAGTALVAWESQQGSSIDAVARTVSATGTPTAAAVTASGSTSSNFKPNAIGGGGGFITYWVSDTAVHERLLPTGSAPPAEQTLMALGTANNRVAAVDTGAGDALLAFPDTPLNTMITVVRVRPDGVVRMGPTHFSAALATNLHSAWTGTELGVLYRETSGLVQTHLARFRGDTTFIADAAISNATTTSELAIDWAGDRYVAAVETNQGVIVKFVAF